MDEEVNRSHARKLFAMAAEMILVAREIERGGVVRPTHLREVREPEVIGNNLVPPDRDDPLLGEMALQLYRDRRRRAEVFGAENLFREPAWDILLDLYIAAHNGTEVSVTSACVGAAVPETTALRWLKVLEDANLVERERDNRDHRRILVQITKDGFTKMSEFFRRSRHQQATDQFQRADQQNN